MIDDHLSEFWYQEWSKTTGRVKELEAALREIADYPVISRFVDTGGILRNGTQMIARRALEGNHERPRAAAARI